MLETTLVALQDIMLDKTLDDSGRRALCSEFAKIMQQVKHFLASLLSLSLENTKFGLNLLQGYANLPAGICVSSMGRPVSYEQATVWKVVDDNESNHCLAFTLVSWSFV
jgi:homeobox-leucine zipper protein